ncbi:putative tail protein [Brevundimonas phage vB_BpoS-Marchewka]|uniref:receptor protein-tyrosine kinase n=1 Tax=Brevundimonas phage vB_BpoS-Marchewka TaxID=2948604 RepID=A0A9E7N3A4_9CAUD|nr:putative tail protein [Brevundimonas phage vB_BpoS-Marchewka]
MTDYTPILHLPQVAANQEQKEATINTAIAILEAAMNDALTVSLAAGDVTLNTDQFTKYFLLQFAGHTAARTVTVPGTPRWFAIENQGTASVVVKVAGTGLSAELPANRIGLVVSDGADVRFVVPDPISGMGLLRDLSDVSGMPTDGQLLRYNAATNSWSPWTLAMSFAQLTDTPSSLAGNAGSLVAVNAAGTRLEFVSSAANVNSFVDLDDTPNSYAGAANRHVVVNAGGSGLTYATPYLRENSDFPNSYAGQSGKFVQVNATNNGVQFAMPTVADLSNGPGAPVFADALTYLRVNAAGTGWEYAPGTGGPVNFTELLDTPNSFTGQAGKLARVATDEDRLIFGTLRLTELSDTPNVYTDAAGMVLRVNSTQSGMVFGRLKLADLSDGPGAMAPANALRYLRVNANGTALEYVRPSITEMAGVASMVGAGGRFVRVNGNEDGFEYVLNAVDVAFIGLTDTPANYQNAQNKFVAVNPAGTGLIFVPAPSGGGGGGATTLDQLTDVTIVDPAAGEVLTYRDGVWGSEPVPATGGGANALVELTDVAYPDGPPTEDYVLTYKSGFWTPQPSATAAIPQALDDLTDVDFSAGTPLNGDLLTFYNGVWVYAPPQAIAGEGLRFGEHRDWRLFFRTPAAVAIDITALILREGAGLPQAAVGGTPAASAEPSGFPAAAAFDDDPATYWRAPSDAADESWLRYTFAAPVEINALTLTPAALRQLPIAWDVQFSDDGGLTWITAWSETRVSGWGAAETLESIPTRAKLSFAQLSDSPGPMTAHGGKVVRVSEDGTKLEYAVFTPPISDLADLGDVNLNPAPVNGEVLTFKDGEWIAEPPAATVLPDIALDDLTDAATAGQQDGDLLGRRGGLWTPVTSPTDLGRHAYWRVVVDDTAAYPGTTTVVIAELLLRAVPGGPQQATGGTAIGTGGNQNGAFDGTTGDAWTAALPDAWIGYHFAAPVALQEIAVTASAVAGWATNYSPEVLRVQYSDDGVTWFAGWTVTGQTGWTTAQQRVFTRPGVTTSFLDHRDTPSTYVAQANKLVQVKADESGLEFVPKPSIPATLNDLTDVDLTVAPTADQLLTFKDGVWTAEDAAKVDYADLLNPPMIPTTLDDLVDVDLTEPSPEFGEVLTYVNVVDVGGVWRARRMRLSMLGDVRQPPNPTNGQVLTWIDSGVEGSGYWEARTPDGSGPGGDYPIYIYDGRQIESGVGVPDWAMPSGSLYMRHDPGDLYVSRATPRLAAKIEQTRGFVSPNPGPLTWAYDQPIQTGNWLILVYASGTSGPVSLDALWTVVNTAPGADINVTIAYRKIDDTEASPLPITATATPEDAWAVYEVSGLGDAWADFYQTAFAAGSTSGAFAPAAYTAPTSSPYTFAIGALFEKGGTTPGTLRGEFGNEPIADRVDALNMSVAGTWSLDPDADATVTATLGAGSPLWAYAAIYFDTLHRYGENLEPAWIKVALDGDALTTSLAALTDVDLTTPPVDGQGLVYRDGVWTADDLAPAELDPARQALPLEIVNPGAELGVTGWTMTAGAFTAGAVPGSDGANAFRATQNTGVCEMAQTIALDPALADFIDAGRGTVTVAFRYIYTSTEATRAQVTIEALDAAGVPIDSGASPQYLTTAAWQTGTVTHALPPLTRSVRLVANSTRTSTWNYGAFDSFAGQVMVSSTYPALADLPDVGPWTAAPQPGEVLTFRDGAWQHETPPPSEVKFGAHAYWRVIFHNTSTASWVTAKELIFRAAAGGPQLATGGTASSSTAWPGQVAANAFDGDPLTKWQNNGDNDGAWIRYAFPTPVEVNHVTLTVDSSRTATSLGVQYSDDGVTWITAWKDVRASWANGATLELAPTQSKQAFARLGDGPGPLGGQGGKLVAVDAAGVALTYVPSVTKLNDLSDVSVEPTADQVMTYRNGAWLSDVAPVSAHLSFGAHTRWRIYFRTTVSDYITVRDVVMSHVFGGPQLAVGGTPTASSTRSATYSADKAFDADTATYWQSVLSASTGTWLRYDFASPVEIGHVSLTTAGTRTGAIAWDVQYSDDGTNWTTAYSRGTATGWTAPTLYPTGSRDRIAFTRLIDAPASYAGQGGKVVAVRADGQGLEFLPFADGTLKIPTHRGEYGVTTGYVTYDFEGFPPDVFANAYAAGWAIVDQDDAPYTKVLKSPIIGANSATEFTFTVVADATTPNLTLRYRVQSEPSVDLFRVYVDDVQVLSDSGAENPFKTFTTPLATGTRTIRLRYAKDGTSDRGSDDVRLSYIRCNGVYSAEPYVAGDTVTHDGVFYICLVNGATDAPGTSGQWQRLPDRLGQLDGVDLSTAPAADQVLTFKDGVWSARNLPASSGGVPALSELTDVTFDTPPAEDNVLTFKDGAWRPGAGVRGLFLENAEIGSGEGPPVDLKPAGSFYIDELTQQVYQSDFHPPTLAPAPTIVQQVLAMVSTGASGPAPVTAVLPATPQAGNWLVALLCEQTVPTAGSGWTLVPDAPVSSADRVIPAMAYRQATGADTATLTPFVTGSTPSITSAGAVAIFEIAGLSSWEDAVAGIVWEDQTTYLASASGVDRAPLTAPENHDSLALALYAVRPSSATLTVTAPWTVLAQDSGTVSTSNRRAVLASAVVSASASIAPKAAFTGMTEAGFVSVILKGPAEPQGGWSRYTGNLSLTDLVNVADTAATQGTVLTYRDGQWTPETPETGVAGTGEPEVVAPLGTIYQRRDDIGEAWVATLVPNTLPATQTYQATGARQTFTVVGPYTSLTFHMWGAGGGGGSYSGSQGGTSGAGGFTVATIPVADGDVIELDVPTGGGAGIRTPGSVGAGFGGWPDGGEGRMGDVMPGGGGGSARVWKNGVLMAVAGGGGGGSGYVTAGGAGGGVAGQNASSSGGTGGTQTAGGYAAATPAASDKFGGYLMGGVGGAGADRFVTTADDGAGGGGGYYGGGGGGGDGRAGGGGSGYLNAAAGVVGTLVAGDRLVPGGTDDPHYQTGIGIGVPPTNTPASGVPGAPGQIVMVSTPPVQGWRRLSTTDDLAPAFEQDLLKISVQAEADGDYVLALSDRRGFRSFSSTFNRTVTVPPHSAVAFPLGASVSVRRSGAGTLTVLAGAGVTLEYPADMLPRLRRPHSVASLVQTATDVWSLFGDLEPV